MVHRQVVGSEERFHLMRYWRAEEGICSQLEEILSQPSWELPVDLTETKFSRIQSDPDQMNAAR